MRLSVGPVPAASARSWTGWALDVLRALRVEPTSTTPLGPQVLDAVDAHVQMWARSAAMGGEVFRWRGHLDAEELEYLANGLCNLDLRVATPGHRCPGGLEPQEGQAFHVVLVEALLFALAQEGASRAAFAEQLRSAWPVADLSADELSVTRPKNTYGSLSRSRSS